MKTVYLDILENYKNEIKSGKYKPHDKLPSVREIMKIHNVSINTANRVISEIINLKLGYHINGVGTFLNEPSKDIAILTTIDIIEQKQGKWHKSLFNHLIKHLLMHGYVPKISFERDPLDPNDNIKYSHLEEKRILNTIGGALLPLHTYMEDVLAENNITFVESCMAVPRFKCCTVLNYDKLVEIAVNILKEKKIDRYDVMYFNFERDNNPYHSEKMRELVTSITDEKNKYIMVDASTGYRSYLTSARETFVNWWNQKDRPDTLFILEDNILDVILEDIKNLGIKIGSDLKIITHASSEYLFDSNVSLYKVGFDVDEVAEKLVNLLDKKLKDPNYNEIIYIDPKVSIGDSLG